MEKLHFALGLLTIVFFAVAVNSQIPAPSLQNYLEHGKGDRTMNLRVDTLESQIRGLTFELEALKTARRE